MSADDQSSSSCFPNPVPTLPDQQTLSFDDKTYRSSARPGPAFPGLAAVRLAIDVMVCSSPGSGVARSGWTAGRGVDLDVAELAARRRVIAGADVTTLDRSAQCRIITYQSGVQRAATPS